MNFRMTRLAKPLNRKMMLLRISQIVMSFWFAFRYAFRALVWPSDNAISQGISNRTACVNPKFVFEVLLVSLFFTLRTLMISLRNFFSCLCFLKPLLPMTILISPLISLFAVLEFLTLRVFPEISTNFFLDITFASVFTLLNFEAAFAITGVSRNVLLGFVKSSRLRLYSLAGNAGVGENLFGHGGLHDRSMCLETSLGA